MSHVAWSMCLVHGQWSRCHSGAVWDHGNLELNGVQIQIEKGAVLRAGHAQARHNLPLDDYLHSCAGGLCIFACPVHMAVDNCIKTRSVKRIWTAIYTCTAWKLMPIMRPFDKLLKTLIYFDFFFIPWTTEPYLNRHNDSDLCCVWPAGTVCFHFTRQTEVGNFTDKSLVDQNVPRSQVLTTVTYSQWYQATSHRHETSNI